MIKEIKEYLANATEDLNGLKLSVNLIALKRNEYG